MPESSELAELRAAWRSESERHPTIDVQQLHHRRTRELHARTRAEILTSISAALLFAAFLAWRLLPGQERLVLFGCGAVLLWAVVTVLRFRQQLRRNRTAADALARTGLEHYRGELRRRRDHLRGAWIWHGPLGLACLLSAAALSRQMVPGRFWQALPVLVLLAGWAAFGIRQRLRQAGELQRELDDIDP
jgi:hypothetical protein